jgi:hypothetical protein
MLHEKTLTRRIGMRSGSLISCVLTLTVFLAAAGAVAVEKKAPPKLPEGAHGFSGTVQGKVVSIKGTRFFLDIEKVVNVWKNNKAEDPESLAGTKTMVVARQKEGKHANFVKTLKVDEELTIELRHEKGNTLNILELNEEQRKRADGAQ